MQKNNILNLDFLKGDKPLWIAILLVSIFSILAVYSASTNLQHTLGKGTAAEHLMKHGGFVVLGILFMSLIAGKVRYQLIGKIILLPLLFCVGLLLFTLTSGQTISGASASRWLTIPGTPISFQPSTFAYLVLIIYLCRRLTLRKETTTWVSVLSVFVPILAIGGLVIRDNGSMGLIIFGVSIVVLFFGQFKTKYILIFAGVSTFLLTIFVLLALYTNVLGANRVHTWKSRVENFMGVNKDSEETFNAKNYQVMQAKAAIVHGGFTGKGPGKSALKQSLPQSSSDFIFAIIVEEYGFIGALFLMILYGWILVRIQSIANRIDDFYGTLLTLSIGIMIFVQLAINISVSLNIGPVTGQPLPLISYGGTSMLVTYIQLGIVLNVSSQIKPKQVEQEEIL